MSNFQTYYHFKLDFQKVDQHTGGKWLIHNVYLMFDIISVRYKEKGTLLMMSQWPFQPPSPFFATATVCSYDDLGQINGIARGVQSYGNVLKCDKHHLSMG